MPDQEPTPPANITPMAGLLKPVNPNEINMGHPSEIAPINAAPDPAQPSFGTQADVVSAFTFEYKHASKTYRAQITHSQIQGYAIELTKWDGSNWIPSASRLKNGLLSAFIIQQATTQALASAQQTADADEAGPKQPVTG